METVRRTNYFFLYVSDEFFIDLREFLRGTAKLSSAVGQIVALSILKGETCLLGSKEVQVLSGIPATRWVPISQVRQRFHVGPRLIHDLVSKGLVLSDQADERLVELRQRDELLSSTQWNLYAAFYHFMTKWRDVSLPVVLPSEVHELKEYASTRQEKFRQFADRFGKPPNHFRCIPSALRVCELPVMKKEGPLYNLLLKRKTTRAFDKRSRMALEDLSVVLYYVWGCQGYTRVSDDAIGLKKTSPSGGGLHPVEVYPLITNVERLDPGLYHYNAKDHSLELLTEMNREEAAESANQFTAGQSYPRSAHVLFIMTGRFYRNFWKYRQHQKSYSVIFMDAAHLSQTFYLVCAELGLGAFVTAAINNANIEEKLGLDGITEGALVMCGCGEPSKEVSLDPVFLPYVPRETLL